MVKVVEVSRGQGLGHEAWAEVYNAAEPQVGRWVCAEELRRADEKRPASLYARRLLAVDEEKGEVVGCGVAMNLMISPDPSLVWVWVSTRPERRREGIGGALWGALVEGAARALPLRQLMCRAGDDNPEGLRFLGARGLEMRQRTVPSTLDLGAWAAGGGEARAEEALARVRGQGVEVMSLGALRERGPGWEEAVWRLNAEVEVRLPSPLPLVAPGLDDFRRLVLEAPSLCWGATQVAVAADGACVGSSFLYRAPADDGLRKIGLTGVRSDYVRRGIATAMKQAMARQAVVEGARELLTENADTNPMLGLNMVLGYKPLPGVRVLLKALS